jgi:biotin transporter BioY
MTAHVSYYKPDTLLGAALAPVDWPRSVGLVFAFSLLMAAAAQFRIHIGLVPITGQVFVVLLTGALLGSRLGASAMIVYLVEGTAGLPFFNGGGSGFAHLLGPTGGYLVAFPAAAFITGAFAENGWDRKFPTAVAAMAIGSLIVLLAGWGWFSYVTNTPPGTAFNLAVKPFIIGDIVKILLAAAVLPTGWALLGRNGMRKGD